MNRLLRTLVLSSLGLAPVAGIAAEEPTVKIEAAAEKGEKPEAAAPAVTVSPEVRKVLDGVRDAYAKLGSLELAGTISANYVIGRENKSNCDTFTATFVAPNKFRHEMKDDMLVGSTGEKIYAYMASQSLYAMKDAPKDRGTIKDLPEPLGQIVAVQNPSLALALVKDAGEQLLNDATAVKKLPDVKLDGKPFTALGVSTPTAEYTFAIDPGTSLVRQVVVDQKVYLEKAGQTDVKQAQVVFEYTKTAVDAVAKDTPFAWAPPASARDLATVAAASGGDENASSKLEGKAAPDFKLADLSGKEIVLSAQKGSVVVVDFWATWCGPCVQSLPHLNKLYEEKKAAGLKVIAVSVDEDKAKVPPFVTDKKLTFTVVIDSEEAKASEKFAVQGIPQTVVIGKDGKVRKVFVGFGPGSEEKLRAEVEAAMK